MPCGLIWMLCSMKSETSSAAAAAVIWNVISSLNLWSLSLLTPVLRSSSTSYSRQAGIVIHKFIKLVIVTTYSFYLSSFTPPLKDRGTQRRSTYVEARISMAITEQDSEKRNNALAHKSVRTDRRTDTQATLHSHASCSFLFICALNFSFSPLSKSAAIPFSFSSSFSVVGQPKKVSFLSSFSPPKWEINASLKNGAHSCFF